MTENIKSEMGNRRAACSLGEGSCLSSPTTCLQYFGFVMSLVTLPWNCVARGCLRILSGSYFITVTDFISVQTVWNCIHIVLVVDVTESVYNKMQQY